MYTPSLKRPALYTGGKLAFSADGSAFACLSSSGGVNVVDPLAPLGRVKHVVAADEELSSFALSRRDVLATASTKGLIRLFELSSGVELRHFASHHTGPVSEMAFDPSDECLATGSTDFAVRVWSTSGGFATHNFRGHKAIVASLRFHPSTSKLWLASSDVAGQVCVWDLVAKHAVCWLRNHMSSVPSTAFVSLDVLVSAGRDKVLSVWRIAQGKGALEKTLPVGEALEAVEPLPALSQPPRFCTAGSEGVVKVWRLSDYSVILAVRDPGEGALAGLCMAGKLLCAYSAQECVLHFYAAAGGMDQGKEARSPLIGYDDEVMDVAWLDDDSLVAATTASRARVYSTRTGDVRLLTPGHDGPVLSCCVSRKGGFIVTGGKDQTARVYASKDLSALGVCQGHNGAVTAVAACENSLHFVTTGGEDKSLHLWRLDRSKGPKNLLHRVAHAKDVTALCLSPNDALVGTASLDKTARVWKLDAAKAHLELAVELKGHRRAVTSLSFSSVDRACVTGSADCTVRVWNVADGACLRTLEGHGAAVTAALFLPGGQRLVTFAGDGVLKTWDVRSSACLQTASEHSDKVWAAALNGSSGARLASVGEAGELVVWADDWDSLAAQKEAEARKAVQARDELDRAVRERDLKRACALALKMDRPHQLRTLLAEASDEEVEVVVRACDDEALKRLAAVATQWNTQARTCLVAQRVIAALLLVKDLSQRLGAKASAELSNGSLPYTARHQARLGKLMRMSHLIDQI